MATKLLNPIISTTESKSGVRNVITNRRVSTGRIKTACAGFVPFEGTLERDFLYLADFNSRISDITAQPLRITYNVDSDTVSRYTPDFLIKFRSIGNEQAWSPILYEVKYREELQDRWQELRPRFRAATSLCRERGWRFRIVTEQFIRTPFLKNVIFLRNYLVWSDEGGLATVLMQAIRELGQSTPAELLAASFWNKDRRMTAVGVLWNLVATRGIGADLTEPLTMNSEIWCVEDAYNG